MMTSNLDITQEGSRSSVEHLVGTIELGEFADWDIFADLQQHSSSLPFEDEADNWELIDPFVSGTEDRTFPEASLRTRSGVVLQFLSNIGMYPRVFRIL